MNGFILVDKEKGYTSRDIVNIIGKKFNTKRTGHTGTLDPMATGLLLIGINNGLNVIDLLSNDTKEYVATVQVGISTDTLDITGKVVREDNNYTIDKDKINKVLMSFLGKSLQEVPLYSSVKVKGKRLYEYARNNIEVELPKREIEIYSMELLGITNDTFTFKCLVSKGTYIRSLIRDIGLKLNILTTMSSLRRIKLGKYIIDDSYSLNDIENNNYKIIDILDVLSDYKIIEVDDYLENKISNGCVLENRYSSDIVVFVGKSKKVIGIYEVYSKDRNKIKPKRILKFD